MYLVYSLYETKYKWEPTAEKNTPDLFHMNTQLLSSGHYY